MQHHSFPMNPTRCGVLLVALTAMLVGCSSVPLDASSVESRTDSNSASGSAGSGAPNSVVIGAGGANANSKDLASWDKLPKVVYFDLDSYVVKEDYISVVESNARALAANRSRRLVIAGHTDERGGREYNLALGQKRAESVAKSLTVLGAAANQLEAVSFGKERPAASGTGEAVWSQNRRAELSPR